MRAASRLAALWERRRFRKDGITLLVNRASRDTEVQPDLIGRAVNLPVMRATVPAAFRDLEEAVNAGIPDRLGDGPVREGILAVSRELQLVRPRKRRSLFSRVEDAGQVTLEAMALLPYVIGMVLLCWQLALVGWTWAWGQHAVREGARELAVRGAADQLVVEQVVTQVVTDNLPGSMRDGLDVRTSGAVVHAEVRVPLPVPTWMTPWTLSVQQGAVQEPRL
jgi:pilus assembly protein CpaE